MNKILPYKINIWEKHDSTNWVVVTTNGVVDKHGNAVMGGGIALEAKENFPRLPQKLGYAIEEIDNQTFAWPEYYLFTLPTKHHWKDRSDIELIKTEFARLYDIVNQKDCLHIEKIYCPLLGCGLGGLNWNYVAEEIYPTYLKFNGRLIFCTF